MKPAPNTRLNVSDEDEGIYSEPNTDDVIYNTDNVIYNTPSLTAVNGSDDDGDYDSPYQQLEQKPANNQVGYLIFIFTQMEYFWRLTNVSLVLKMCHISCCS